MTKVDKILKTIGKEVIIRNNGIKLNSNRKPAENWGKLV